MQRLTFLHVIISLALFLLAPTLFLAARAQEQKRAADVLLPVRLGGKWGYINGAGSVVVAPQFDYAFPFTSGLALVVANRKIPSIGFLDETGQMAIKPQFWRVSAFSEGLAPVDSCGEYGFINSKGHVVIYPQFAFASKFSEGLSKVRVGEKWGDGKWGYIDKTGRLVIKPELEDVSSDTGDCDSFSEGLACISVQEKVGYIDKTGRVVIQPQFDLASSFSNGIASVALGRYSTDNPESDVVSSGDMWGYIDKTGKYIWKPSK